MRSALSKSLLTPALLLVSLLVAGCQSDLRNDTEEDDQNVVADPGLAGNLTTDQFELSVTDATLQLVEGEGLSNLPITVTRADGHISDINFFVSGVTATDDRLLTRQFDDAVLSADEQETRLQLAVSIGASPIQAHERSIQISAIDSTGATAALVLNVQVQPTSAPDVYLLIGQSNMVGSSEANAKIATLGGIDAPDERIRQLNVTFNDVDNFPNAASFTNPNNLLNLGEPITIALDPLHSGLESDGEKSGTQVGLGLSFAKRALPDTTSQIVLVPAAWSDTGFCRRESNRLPGLGWNAVPKTDAAFSGTLLHDRAIARANIALEQTGGVLRGILWHQGEADSDNAVCATAYSDNLLEMIRSLRSNIATDARGSSARGADADIPFIVGTMAKGGEQSPFPPNKLIVDGTHRTIDSLINGAAHVNSDDLVPPDYACGAGSCIHFGADALREMGFRYYDALSSTIQ